MTFLMLSVILLFMLMILFSTLSVIRHLIYGTKKNRLLNLNMIYKTLCGTGVGRGLLTSMLEKLNFFHVTSLITVLICSMKFLSQKVALYLYKSTIQPCMAYCCYICASAWSCYLELLDKLQKQICKTVMLVFQLLPLKPLSHCWNVASLGIFFRYYFGRCSSELAPLVPLPILVGGILLILIDYMIVLSPFLDVTRMSTVPFLAQLESCMLCL